MKKIVILIVLGTIFGGCSPIEKKKTNNKKIFRNGIELSLQKIPSEPVWLEKTKNMVFEKDGNVIRYYTDTGVVSDIEPMVESPAIYYFELPTSPFTGEISVRGIHVDPNIPKDLDTLKFIDYSLE